MLFLKTLGIGYIPIDKLRESNPDGKAEFPYAYRLQHTSIAELFQNNGRVEQHGCFRVVGFDTPNKVGITPVMLKHYPSG